MARWPARGRLSFPRPASPRPGSPFMLGIRLPHARRSAVGGWRLGRCEMALRIVTQHSDHAKVWFDLPVTLTGTMLEIPAGSLWLDGVAYSLPAFAFDVN